MFPRITLRDIAQKAGVHHSTVSRALKHDRSIPPKTRTLILRVAKKLNYRPDPMLSAIAVYRNRNTKRMYRATLGWITNYPTRDGWKEYEREAYFKAAVSRSTELGYVIEEFWLRESGMTQARAIKILRARNIQGLIFVSHARPHAHLNRQWSSFPAITFGHTLSQPIFHHVDNDHFRSFALLMRRLKRLGYRRPGFAIWPRIHEMVDRNWTAAFWAHQNTPVRQQIPIFMEESWTRDNFKKWFYRHRPDVVISHDETLLKWIESWKIKVPADVGFALAAKHKSASPRCSGIDENSEQVARCAVDILVDLINRGAGGIQATPLSLLVEGRWIEGSTLRRLNR